MKAFLEARKKIFGAAIIILLIMVMMSLNSRLGEYFRLDRQRDTLSSEVNQLMRTRVVLETQVAYATSDQAVEDWAREDAHMAKPGDKVIIQLPAGDQAETPQTPPVPTPRSIENWEVWWALFFGE